MFAAGIALNFLSSVILVAAATALYVTFRPHERALAMFGSFVFLAAGVGFMGSAVTGMALFELGDEFGSASGAQADRLVTTARAVALVDFSSGAFLFLALGLLAFGALIAWSGALPRWLGWLAVLIAPLTLLGFLTFVADIFFVFILADGIAAVLWFILTGSWLFRRGTQEAGATG